MVQNKSLRRILGAYKRTPIPAIKKESETMPLDLYLELLAMQRADTTASHEVTKEIQNILDKICIAASRVEGRRQRK